MIEEAMKRAASENWKLTSEFDAIRTEPLVVECSAIVSKEVDFRYDVPGHNKVFSAYVRGADLPRFAGRHVTNPQGVDISVMILASKASEFGELARGDEVTIEYSQGYWWLKHKRSKP